ncbi:MAG: YceI family protein [Melioribacteraceae bacterium]|nr:YceI family protein [Melioribacteraceae bacterium]
MINDKFYRILILIFILLFSIKINANEYVVKKTKNNLVKFISEAPVENFDGVTNNIDGYLYFEENFAKNSQLYFEVDLNTVDTGIGLRNRHMRENYLETDKYRYAIFSGKIISYNKINEKEFDVNLNGEMKIHGVTKNVSLTGKIFLVGNELNIKSKFSVKLSDYNIEIPKLMFMKINEEIKLELDFFMMENKK